VKQKTRFLPISIYNIFNSLLIISTDEGGYTGDFNQFFEDWISDKIIFGSWIKHLKEFMAAAQDPSNRILLMKYEDMKTDLSGCVQRVAQFLESPLDPSDIEAQIVPKVSGALLLCMHVCVQ
jgi:hypothetical protein